MSIEDQKKKGKPEKEIRQPMSGGFRHAAMFDKRNKKLDNPRKVLWKFLFSYLKSYKKSFIFFLVLLLIGTSIMSISPILTAVIIDKGIIGQDALLILNMSIFFLSIMIFMAISQYISQYGLSLIHI